MNEGRTFKSLSLASILNGREFSIEGIDEEKLRQQRRIEQVHGYWKQLMEDIFLAHTNSVFIFTKDELKYLVVYVDEAIYAAELNARRELIKMQFKKKFNEDIDIFEINISKGRFKRDYPFVDSAVESKKKNLVSVPLDTRELSYVDHVCASISDEKLRECFKKAMISDLEWKKSENEENTSA